MSAAAEGRSFRLVGTLAAAGLASGIVLAGVFLATEPRIQRNRAEALAAAILRVLPGSTSTAAFVARDGRLERLADEEGRVPPDEAVFAGYDDGGRLVGYAIPADGSGYMDTIELIFGYDPRAQRVVGMEVLESRETPGLGDKIITDDRFLENFRALAVDPGIVTVKRGEKTEPWQVDTITGATISSESVVAIVEAGLARWRPLLDAAAKTETAAGAPAAVGTETAAGGGRDG